MPGKLAAVIPFFQREKGILHRAVRSALAQKGVAPFLIIVVDDASPIAAREEVADLLAAHPDRIAIVERTNGGPGPARNTALDLLGPDVEYVAFLDSDDEWRDDHIARAVSALEQGFDFFFSDFLPLESPATEFTLKALDPKAHRRLGPDPFAHAFVGDRVEGVLNGYVGLSTVVYRFRRFSTLRFHALFCGEDHILWLQILRETDRVVFSTAVEVVFGRGVNIYQRTEWGSEAVLKRICSEIRYRQWVARSLDHTPARKATIKRQIEASRSVFIETVLHRLRRRLPFDAGLVADYLKADPLAALAVPSTMVRAAWRSFGARSSP